MLAKQNPATDDIWNSADDSLGAPAGAPTPVGGPSDKEHEIPPETEPVLQEISHEPAELEHQQELQEQGLIERIHQEGELMEKAKELGIEAEQKELTPVITEPKLNLPLGEDQILVQKKGPTDNALTWLAMWAFAQILKYLKHLGYIVKVAGGKITKRKIS